MCRLAPVENARRLAMTPSRMTLPKTWPGAVFAAALVAQPVLARPTAPRAQPAQVTIDYTVTLAGLSIGTAQLGGTFDRGSYKLDISARLTGLAGMVTGGYGSAQARGSLLPGRTLPGSFAVASHNSSAEITVRMALARGNATAVEITPPLPPAPDRVPVTPADKRGVIDPGSALIMSVRAAGTPFDPANCNRMIPVFDGASRFNVVLSYGEVRPLDKPGYSGPVLVCNARYQAVAGHRPDRPGVKFMEENREMSVWLAPVEGAGVLVPLRISILTTMGTNIIEATRFTRAGAEGRTAEAGASQAGMN